MSRNRAPAFAGIAPTQLHSLPIRPADDVGGAVGRDADHVRGLVGTIRAPQRLAVLIGQPCGRGHRLALDARIEQLQAQAIEKLKKFEFMLRRNTESGNESLSLSGSDQVPEGFRQAIEEYYRSLAKRQQK